MAADPYSRFKHLTYDRFRELATDNSLSPYEKIGFPDSYRAGREAAIFADIRAKVGNLNQNCQIVLDIGPGCTDVPRMFAELCAERQHQLLLVDAPEMLALLPDADHIRKYEGRFPDDCAALVSEYTGRVNTIVAYSVFHYVYVEGNIFRFVDECLQLLAHNGVMLIGDIPNMSKRKRFFASPDGARFHREFMKTSAAPEVIFNQPEPGEIDDAVLLGVVMRVRAAGCDAWVVPQDPALPMANRREDILIRKP
jgi:hypothetical protein